MKKLSVLMVFVFSFFYHHRTLAQDFSIGARAAGIGNAFVTLQDEWAVFGNAGGMAEVKSITALFAYENRFGFTEGFQSVAAGVIVPTHFGNGSLSAYRFGDELFSKQKVAIGWAHQISGISIGFKANYWQHHVEGYGSRGNLVLDLGGVAAIIPKLAFGLHIANVNQAKIVEDERIPTVIQAGLAYTPVEQLMLVVETEKDVDFDAVFKLGMEYQIIEKIRLRTGISTKPMRTHYGMGFCLKKFTIDCAMITHPHLGFSNQVSVAYRVK